MFGAHVVLECGSDLPRGGSVQGPKYMLIILLSFKFVTRPDNSSNWNYSVLYFPVNIDVKRSCIDPEGFLVLQRILYTVMR